MEECDVKIRLIKQRLQLWYKGENFQFTQSYILQQIHVNIFYIFIVFLYMYIFIASLIIHSKIDYGFCYNIYAS